MKSMQTIYLARHGETRGRQCGRHTGRNDVPLTDRGEQDARQLGDRLDGFTFAKVLTSPLQRAVRTCPLAGRGDDARYLALSTAGLNAIDYEHTPAEPVIRFGRHEPRG